MFFLTDNLSTILKILKRDGLDDFGVKNVKGVVDIYKRGRNGQYVCVLGLISLVGTVEESFERIHDCLVEVAKNHGKMPAEIILQGGGSLPVPEAFRDWCEANDIRIRILEASEILKGRIEIGI